MIDILPEQRKDRRHWRQHASGRQRRRHPPPARSHRSCTTTRRASACGSVIVTKSIRVTSRPWNSTAWSSWQHPTQPIMQVLELPTEIIRISSARWCQRILITTSRPLRSEPVLHGTGQSGRGVCGVAQSARADGLMTPRLAAVPRAPLRREERACGTAAKPKTSHFPTLFPLSFSIA